MAANRRQGGIHAIALLICAPACHPRGVLAETISLDGGELALILAIGLLVLALVVAIVVLGFVLAPRAAHGSGAALFWWILILVLEGLFCLGAVAAVVAGDFTLWTFTPIAIVAGQIALFVSARREVE